MCSWSHNTVQRNFNSQRECSFFFWFDVSRTALVTFYTIMSGHGSQQVKTSWFHLTSGKEFSRLLYPNPVCFLCTSSSSTAVPSRATTEAKQQDATSKGDDDTSRSLKDADKNENKKNVMIVSWLTASNNDGNFIMSLNRHRHSTNLLLQEENKDFSLCIPISGMEDLILSVGSISGRFGSKFGRSLDSQHQQEQQKEQQQQQQLSKRQLKKQKRQRWAIEGIPGLVPIPYGQNDTEESSSSPVFAIQGTVAHLHCRLLSSSLGTIDDDHYLLTGKVIDAYCHSDYWDSDRNIFCPKQGINNSYLTFLGSQTFGQVQSK